MENCKVDKATKKWRGNHEMHQHKLKLCGNSAAMFVSHVACSVFHVVAETFFPRESILFAVYIAQLLFSEAPSLHTKTNHNVNQLDLT